MLELEQLLHAIRQLHDRIRERVWTATKTQCTEQLSQIVADEDLGGGDIVFAIDRVSES